MGSDNGTGSRICGLHPGARCRDRTHALGSVRSASSATTTPPHRPSSSAPERSRRQTVTRTARLKPLSAGLRRDGLAAAFRARSYLPALVWRYAKTNTSRSPAPEKPRRATEKRGGVPGPGRAVHSVFALLKPSNAEVEPMIFQIVAMICVAGMQPQDCAPEVGYSRDVAIIGEVPERDHVQHPSAVVSGRNSCVSEPGAGRVHQNQVRSQGVTLTWRASTLRRASL